MVSIINIQKREFSKEDTLEEISAEFLSYSASQVAKITAFQEKASSDELRSKALWSSKLTRSSRDSLPYAKQIDFEQLNYEWPIAWNYAKLKRPSDKTHPLFVQQFSIKWQRE